MDAKTIVEVISALWVPIAGLSSMFFGILVFTIKLQTRVQYLEEQLIVHKVAHEKVVDAMWGEIKGFNGSVNKVLEGFYRLEGKIDALMRNP